MKDIDIERLLDNAATASQVIELLRDDDGEETSLREAVRINVVEPLLRSSEADQRDAAVLRMIEAIAPETVKNWRAMLPAYEAGQAAMSAQSDTEEKHR